MTQPKRPPENNLNFDPTFVMIFAVVTGVIVLLGVGLLAVLLSVRLGSNVAASASSQVDGPYGTRKRPIPQVKTIDQLFPQTLGSFQRQQVQGGLNGNFRAVYAQGTALITISGAAAVTQSAARQLVEQLALQRGAASEAQRFDPGVFNFSYYFDIRPNDVRFAWSRDRWMFDVTTGDRATLDAMMLVFPY